MSGLATWNLSGESVRLSWWAVLPLEPEVDSQFECPGEWSCYLNLKPRFISNDLVSGLPTRTWSRFITNVLVSGLATRAWSQASLQMSWWVALLQEPDVENHCKCTGEWSCYKNRKSRVTTNVLVSGLATKTLSRESLRVSWWMIVLLEPYAAIHYECPGEWPCYKNMKSSVITNVLVSGLATGIWRRKSLQMYWWVVLLQEHEVGSYYKCPDEWSCY